MEYTERDSVAKIASECECQEGPRSAVCMLEDRKVTDEIQTVDLRTKGLNVNPDLNLIAQKPGKSASVRQKIKVSAELESESAFWIQVFNKFDDGYSF